jgi:hypothetical protein
MSSLPASAEVASDRGVKAACRLIEAEMRHCSCVTDFLGQHLGPDQGLLLLKLWAAGAGRLGDRPRAFTAIYGKYGEARALQTAINFLMVRTEFLSRCTPSEAFFEEATVVVADPDGSPALPWGASSHRTEDQFRIH